MDNSKTEKDKRGLILVMSHMRSYSTLLVHLLNTSKAVSGTCELHQSYTDEESVTATIEELTDGAQFLACDNVLHDTYPVSADLAEDDRIKWLFSVREPEATIKSMWRWGGPKKRFRDWHIAADYYCQRLQTLQQTASGVGEKLIYINPEVLISDTERALGFLVNSLELPDSLNQDYELNKDTGNPRSGDFSKYIKSGSIQRNRDYVLQPEIDLDALKRCQERYDEVTAKLASIASTSLTP